MTTPINLDLAPKSEVRESAIVSRRSLLTMSTVGAAAIALAACGDRNDGYDGPSASTRSTQAAPPTTEPLAQSAAGIANLDLFRTSASIELAATAIYAKLIGTKISATGFATLGDDPTNTTTTTTASTTTTTLIKPSNLLLDPRRKALADRSKGMHDTHLKFFEGFVGRFGSDPITNPNTFALGTATNVFSTLERNGLSSVSAKESAGSAALVAFIELELLCAETYQQFANAVRTDGYTDLALTAARQYRVAFMSCAATSRRAATYGATLLGSLNIKDSFASTSNRAVKVGQGF